MNRRIIKQLFKKEMLDVLRDKKTVLMMVVVPLVIYPLIMIFGMQIMSSVTQEMAKSTYYVGVSGNDTEKYISLFEEFESDNYFVEIKQLEQPEKELLQGNVDMYVEVNVAQDGTELFNIYYLSASNRSNYAVDAVLQVIENYSKGKTNEILLEAGLEPDKVLSPVKISYSDMSTAEESTGNLLGSILPFMLVVSILMGTMYPAIDTTSGEKERGTLETVLTLPVSNKELIFSKFLAVGIFGIASAFLNIISMCGVVAYMLNMMENMGVDTFSKIDISKFILPLIIGILCVFAFAIFVSALSMCVCAFAKSYKEANNYITPVTLVVMLVSFVSFLPNVELTKTMSLVPVANLCLLLKDLLVFKFNYINVLLVLVSNIAYGVIAALALGKIYNSEAVMFGDGQGGIQLFEKRSNMKKGGVPTLGDCGFVVIVMTMIYLYVGSTLQLNYGTIGLVLSQMLFVLFPVLVVVYSKKSMKETFKLRLCRPRLIFGGVLLSLGTIGWNLVISIISTNIFKDSANASQEGLYDYLPQSFILGALVLAVTPAICEEMFFRGYVFAALEGRLRIVTAILLNATLFGAFHMSLAKFLPTAFLGGVMAYLGYKTRSILPGMILHFINNFFSCTVIFHPEWIINISLKLVKGGAIGGLLVVCCLVIVFVLCPIAGIRLLSDKENDKKTVKNT